MKNQRRHKAQEGEILDPEGWAIEVDQPVTIRRPGRKAQSGQVERVFIDERGRAVVDIRRYSDHGLATVLASMVFTRIRPTRGAERAADIMERLGERMPPKKRRVSSPTKRRRSQ